MGKSLLVLGCLVLAVFTSATAKAENGYAYRYDTSYGVWDDTFADSYGYEEEYYQDYSSQCGYRTCYYDNSGAVYKRTRRVYVEETVIERGSYSGYTKVTVYRNSSYEESSRYVTYYTYNRRVVRRRYHVRRRPVFVSPSYSYSYTYNYYTYPDYYYVEIDEATAKIISGIYLIAIGANVAAECADIQDSDAKAICLAAAAGSSAVGSSSVAEGIEDEKRKTQLALQVEKNEAAAKEESYDF